MSLYKYVTSDRIDILEKSMIRFTQPGSFNDPFELMTYFPSLAPDSEIEKRFTADFERIVEMTYDTIPHNLRHNISPNFLRHYYMVSKPQVLGLLKAGANIGADTFNKNMQVEADKYLGILCLTEKPTNLVMWAHYGASHTGFLIELIKPIPFSINEKDQGTLYGT